MANGDPVIALQRYQEYCGSTEKLNNFISEWSGKFVDVDHAYGAQCVDLMRQYLIEVLNLPQLAIPASLYAKDIFKKSVSDTNFTKIVNTPTNAPVPGDIVFWGTYPFVTGIAGHVAICQSADINNLIVFSQNYPTNSPCVLRKFNYWGVMGWLHSKV